MLKYRLYGDIRHSGIVEVKVENLDGLRALLDKEMLTEEDFVICDEQNKNLAFSFDGPILDEDGNEVVLSE